MDWKESYELYRTTGQPAKKLKAALEVYLSLFQDREDRPEWADCRSYLKERRRPAWELLIREENLKGLDCLLKEGWITQDEILRGIQLASAGQKRESQLWLLGQKKGITGTSCNRVGDDTGTEIRRILEGKLLQKAPALSSAFPYLRWKAVSMEKQDDILAVDGRNLYYGASGLERLFLADTEALLRMYLHSLFHCLYLHVIPPENLKRQGNGKLAADTIVQQGNGKLAADTIVRQENGKLAADTIVQKENWNLAADITAEWVLDESGWLAPDSDYEKRRKYYEAIYEACGKRDTGSCYTWVVKEKQRLEPAEWEKLEKLFRRDSHEFWYGTKSAGQESTCNGTLIHDWAKARSHVSLGASLGSAHAGKQSGAGQDLYQSHGRGVYDYRKFLRQFTVCREEMQLDMESFDPIAYYYGRERYGNVLLMEPLETTEMNRLEEFVIAIDTSGSCTAAMVSRFLDETYEILSNRENFFRKMNVHIIQCDSAIQDHQKITCEQEWKDYLDQVTIQGRGGTDFTPVFRLVDQLLAKKEIHHLKGLLYFTDGDGIYPSSKPPYETAFVFLNRRLEKQKVPGWALRLNLDLKEL